VFFCGKLRKMTPQTNIKLNKNAAVYAILRCSTNEQVKEGREGLSGQKKVIEAYVRSNDLPDPEWISDLGVSAFNFKNMKTGNLGQLLVRLSGKPIKGTRPKLLFAFASRLTRAEPIEAIFQIQSYVRHGIDFVFCDCGIELNKGLETMMYSVMYHQAFMQVAQSNKESEDKSFYTTNTHEAMRKKLLVGEKGVKPDRSANLYNIYSWWFKKDEKTGKIVPHKENAKIVRRIFKEFTKGSSINKITKDLNVDGITKPSKGFRRLGNGKPAMKVWTSSSVKNVLKSETLIGKRTLYKTIYEEGTERKKREIAMVDGQLAIFPNAYEKIINLETWNLAQALLKKNVASNPKTKGKFNLFQGVLRDGYYDYILRRQHHGGHDYFRPAQYGHIGNKTRITGISGRLFEYAFFKTYSLLKSHHELASRWNVQNDKGQQQAQDDLENKILELETTKQQIEAFDDAAITLGKDYLKRNKHRRDAWVKLEEDLESQIQSEKTTSEIYNNTEITNLFDAILLNGGSEVKRKEVNNFFKATGHEIKLYPNGLRFDKKKLLKKFAEIEPDCINQKHWRNFDDKTFKFNPFKFLNEYMLINTFMGKLPKEKLSNNAREIFDTLFDAEVSVVKGLPFFVCWMPNNRFFAGGFDSIGEKSDCVRWIVFDDMFNSCTLSKSKGKTVIGFARNYDSTVSFESNDFLDMADHQCEKHKEDIQSLINISTDPDEKVDLDEMPTTYKFFWLKNLMSHDYWRREVNAG
jgi:DNA invertase Pin-like site-specific DNA recombinase